jgi:hypothetical protein
LDSGKLIFASSAKDMFEKKSIMFRTQVYFARVVRVHFWFVKGGHPFQACKSIMWISSKYASSNLLMALALPDQTP